MNIIEVFSLVLVLSSLFAYINVRYINMPPTISLMLMGLGLSLVILLVGYLSPDVLSSARNVIKSVHFTDVLLDFMLSFLLFAGSLHTDWDRLKNERGPIITYATFGVILSTFMIGSTLYLILNWFPTVSLTYIHCLLFGALISPTDPIAVLGILKKANVPESMEIKIVGESLFNDGIGVVAFLTIFHIAQHGWEATSAGTIGLLLLKEIAGGIVLGLTLGYLTYRMLKSIDHYQTEILLTLALVMGGYTLASALHFSGPLAMVASGILIGNKGKESAMSDVTLDYTFKFWEIIDEVLNALLFVLIGLELLLVSFQKQYIFLGLICIVVILIARYVSIALPSLVSYKRLFEHRELGIITWSGLRGGISIALALSIPVEMGRDPILTMTYVVVLFSIVVQGLTVERVIKKLTAN